MASWADTPFKSLEQAHQAAESMGLCPGEIAIQNDFRFFQFVENRELSTIAQKVGGGPVKEKTEEKATKRYVDPDVPTFGDKDRWTVGPWILTEHASLEDAEAHYAEVFNNPENLEVIRVIMFRDDDVEREYAQDSRGVWARALHKPKGH